MIFQSLVSLYERLGPSDELPPYGFSVEDIGFYVTIDKAGNLVGQPEDLRTRINANTYDFKTSVVPYTNQVNVRSAKGAAETPNFMVDKADYVFGMSDKSTRKVHHESFINRIHEVCGDSDDTGVVAVKAFLTNWKPSDSVELKDWQEISGDHGKWIAFKLQGDSGFIHERRQVKKLWSDFLEKTKYPQGVSILDGKMHDLQLQYAQFKVGAGSPSGASLVSFNEAAYESYRKKRGENAPIFVEAEFKSSAALKFLLRSNSQRTRIGDAITLFWAERASPMETLFGQVINPAIEDGAAIPVRRFLEDIRQGLMPRELEGDEELKFYILGLSVNKARLALRFWHVCSVSELMNRFRDHFANLEMEHSDRDIPFPGVWHLLRETARETKDISPVLGGALTRSILTGVYYPQNLFQGVIGRIRADQRVNYLRASILKAVLQRNHNKEVPMSLDPDRREVSYLLGRLFAVLEKAQLDALGKINATIKDRFFSAASATPASVFPGLLRLSQHHIDKAEHGYISDRRIGEIMEHINAFPSHMSLKDQGLFAIAYYQQKNALYRKNETKTEGGENE
jgi:CRISPR-associated protein Csd1